MHSIRRRLALILVFCTVLSVLLSAFFVNLAVNNTFEKYISDNQSQRNERIVRYFEEIYKRDLKWTVDSGKEIQHEGYMSKYCITLQDKDKNEIWAMDEAEIYDMSKENAGNKYQMVSLEIHNQGEVVGYVIIGQYEPLLLSEQDTNFKNSINWNIAISVIVTIVFASIISIYFSKQFSRPIKAVSETSVKLSEGSYSSKTDTGSNVVEINNLIKSINILGEKLHYQDDLRKRLVSDISHELRTPLNIFQNNLEAMIDGVFPATTDRLNNLNDEVIRFGKLLNNLDILKELEDNNIQYNMERVDIGELLSKVYETFIIHTAKKNIELFLNINPNDAYIVSGDKDKLRQVFINVLSNAVKFSRSGDSVTVTIHAVKKHIEILIKDTGIGIKKEDLPFIFEHLYRGDKSRNLTEGSGIGLTITKQILLHHNATIEVESEEGIGTLVRIRFKDTATQPRTVNDRRSPHEDSDC